MSPSGLHVGPADQPDRYHLGDPIGADPEGVLYRATVTGGSDVALRMLHACHGGPLVDRLDEWRARVAWLCTLRHPGLARVVDAFVGATPHPAGARRSGLSTLFVASEWVDGVPFDRWLAADPDRPVAERLDLLSSVAAALDLLHAGPPGAAGGVHGDVKAVNVLVRPTGAAVLVDVGVVRGLPGVGRSVIGAGTPGYAAPEVLAGAGPSAAADRYALGVLAHQAVTGEPPGPGGPTLGRDGLLALPGVAPELADAVLGMLDLDPAARPAPARVWCEGLGHVAASPVRHRPPERAPAVELAAPRYREVRRRRAALAAMAAAAAVVAVVVAVTGGGGDGGGGPPPSVLGGALCRDDDLGYVVQEPAGLVPRPDDEAGGPCRVFDDVPGADGAAPGDAAVVVGAFPGPPSRLDSVAEEEVGRRPATAGGRPAVVAEHRAGGATVVTWLVDRGATVLALQLLVPAGADPAAGRARLDELVASLRLTPATCGAVGDPGCAVTAPDVAAAGAPPSIVELVRGR